MDQAQIARMRSFNRLVTLRAGALDASYLGRGRPLGQARLLFEIGTQGDDLRRLRDRLGLDSGYMSRLLKSLSAQGLLKVEDDLGDRRRRRVTLTGKGHAERAAYDALSDEQAARLLARLGPAQRERLLAAMAEVERLMMAASVEITAEPADSEDARACVAAYWKEIDRRFEGGFDPGNGGYGSGAAPDRGHFLLARLDGRPVGCGALRPLDARIGEIKRMWIAPEARGLGLARRLLGALEDCARQAGLTRVRLDTNRALAEAQSFYRKAGYNEIGRYNDNAYADFWFEKVLEG